MSEPARVDHAFLIDVASAPYEIDRCIKSAYRERRPVYIHIPTDMVDMPVNEALLDNKLDLTPLSDPTIEDGIVHACVEAISAAKNPSVLVDALAQRFRAVEETRELVATLNLPTYTTILGKGIVDETSANYVGLYGGYISQPEIRDSIEASDLVIFIGPFRTDSNTGGFTQNIPEGNLISIYPRYVTIRGKKIAGAFITNVLTKLTKAIKGKVPEVKMPNIPPQPYEKAESDSDVIKQSWVWRTLGDFVQDNDIIVIESGTAQFGMPDARFKAKNVLIITQIFYSSIGYSVGAVLGALIGQRELKRPGRVIHIVGDGSLQMTVQELGTAIRYNFTPTIFLINNAGYTIERAIHGPERGYNDIAEGWDYQNMLKFFGAKTSKSHVVKTKGELDRLLADDEFKNGNQIKLAEVFMDKFDSPWRLTDQIAFSQNKQRQWMAQLKQERAKYSLP